MSLPHGPSLPCPHQSKLLRKVIEKIANRGPTPEEHRRWQKHLSEKKRKAEIAAAYDQLADEYRKPEAE